MVASEKLISPIDLDGFSPVLESILTTEVVALSFDLLGSVFDEYFCTGLRITRGGRSSPSFGLGVSGNRMPNVVTAPGFSMELTCVCE